MGSCMQSRTLAKGSSDEEDDEDWLQAAIRRLLLARGSGHSGVCRSLNNCQFHSWLPYYKRLS